MDENEAIANEILAEEERIAKNGSRPLKIEHGQLTGAKIAWTLGAVAIDIATGYAVWQITFWWYGLAWILAGAGGLIYSDWLRERIGNNYDQKTIARYGLNISWVSIALMAIVCGVIYILGYTRVQWVEVFTIVVTLGLFFYHVFQSYRFQILDDEYIEMNEEARELEAHAHELRKIHRAARKVDSKKIERGVAGGYNERHGIAFDTAYGKSFASTVEGTELAPKAQSGQNQN